MCSHQSHWHCYTGKEKEKYTEIAIAESATVGGSSWTKEWLKFDNSYFKVLREQDDVELLVLETDAVLMTDPKCRFILKSFNSLSAVMIIPPVMLMPHLCSLLKCSSSNNGKPCVLIPFPLSTPLAECLSLFRALGFQVCRE